MVGGITAKQKSHIYNLIVDTYKDFEISYDTKSLYVSKSFVNMRDDKFYEVGTKIPMPTFSDFYCKLEELADSENDIDIIELVKLLRPYKRGGKFDMFDCSSSDELINLINNSNITLNIPKIESKVNQIYAYIGLNMVYDRMGKWDTSIKKQIVWAQPELLEGDNNLGFKIILEKLGRIARGIRIRNGGLIIAMNDVTKYE